MDIQLDGKISLLKDAAELKTMDKKELQKLLGTSSGSLEDVKKILDHLADEFANYTRSVPSFLDDFLAPEGIITQKRKVDARLSEAMQSEDKARSEVERLILENKGLNGKID